MTPLDILPLGAKHLIMSLAGVALIMVLSMTVGRMISEIVYCGRGKTEAGDVE